MAEEKTILIVDDEKTIVTILRFNLESRGYRILEAYDGESGLKKARTEKPDLILLDIMLPKMDGFHVCEALRQDGDNVPIILLTAREEEDDKVRGLELGADDYITKPFSNREVVARVEANIRRTAMSARTGETAASDAIPVSENLSINTDSRQVFRAGKANKVYSRVDLMEQVWNYGYVGDDVRTVDVTVRRLREKIEENPASPQFILTRRGAGYYFSLN